MLKTGARENGKKLIANPEQRLVYGEDYASYLYFAGLWDAFSNKLTFEEFQRQSPAGFDLLIRGLCRYQSIDPTALPEIDTEAGEYFDVLFELFYDASREGKSRPGKSTDIELIYLKDAARDFYENDLTATDRFPLRHEVGCSLFEK